jgi:hypothetical protein
LTRKQRLHAKVSATGMIQGNYFTIRRWEGIGVEMIDITTLNSSGFSGILRHEKRFIENSQLI